MICPKCGNEIFEDVVDCPYCGQRIRAISKSVVIEEEKKEEEGFFSKKFGDLSVCIITLIPALLLLTRIICFLYAYLLPTLLSDLLIAVEELLLLIIALAGIILTIVCQVQQIGYLVKSHTISVFFVIKLFSLIICIVSFGGFLINSFTRYIGILAVATGIYLLFHEVLKDEEEEPYKNEYDSYFDGKGSELFLWRLFLLAISLFSCGLATPFILASIKSWEAQHTVIDGKRCIFNGSGSQLFMLWIKWYILSALTLGIYLFFARVDYLKWVTSHTSYEGQIDFDGTYPNSYFTGVALQWAGRALLSYILNVFSVGLASSWNKVMMTKWRWENTVIASDRFVYEGTGSKLFVSCFVTTLLDILTFGIHDSWGFCKLSGMICEDIHIQE